MSRFNYKQTKARFFTLPNTRSNCRLKNSKRGVWNKEALGGFFQKANKWEVR